MSKAMAEAIERVRLIAEDVHGIEGATAALDYQALLDVVEAVEAAPAPHLAAMVDEIVREVAELPDRTSPDDAPDMMLVTADELRSILLDRIKP